MSLVIGLQYIFIKDILAIFGDNIFLLLFLRFFLSILPFVFFIKKIEFKMLLNGRIIVLSLIQPFFNLILQTYGVQLLPVTIVGYLTALNPIFNMSASLIFLKEKVNLKQVFYIILAVSGCILSSIGGASLQRFTIGGVALIVGSLILRSLYSISSKNLSKDCVPLTITFSQLFWGTLLFCISAGIGGQFSAIGSIIKSMQGMDWLSFIYLSFMSLSVAYFLNNYVISKITVITTGVLNNLTFLVTILSGVLFMKEKIGIASIIGSIMILIGVVMAAKERAGFENVYPRKKL